MDKENKVQEEIQGKKCFIITPIGDANSSIFRKAKGVIDSVIKPVLHEYGFNDVKPAYEMNVSGMITTQIINRIISDDLVIVNLTGNNPNVMYELCLRHVVQKPIIHICENGTALPFDIKDNRTIFYEDDMLGADELKEKLSSFVDEIEYMKAYVDNPIYNAQKMGMLLQHTPEDDGKSVEIGLLQKIYERLEKQDSNTYTGNYEIEDDGSLKINIFSKNTFGISIPEDEQYRHFSEIKELMRQLSKRHVNFLRVNKECLIFKNEGNVSSNRIMQIVREFSEKCGVPFIIEGLQSV